MFAFIVDLIIWTLFMLIVLIVFMIAVSKNRFSIFLILLTIYGVGVWVDKVVRENNYKKECGPNAQDIAVMKPQAQVVSDHILKHGIPESLAKTPNLVYPLEGCERSEVYWDKYDSDKVAETIEDSDLLDIREKCYFEKDGRHYNISIRFTDFLTDDEDFGELKLWSNNYDTATTVSYTKYSKDKHFSMYRKNIDTYIKFYSSKTSGICAPFRP